jgi:hypothetical protein
MMAVPNQVMWLAVMRPMSAWAAFRDSGEASASEK